MKSRFIRLPNAVLEDGRLGKAEVAIFACLHTLRSNVYKGQKQVKASRKLIAAYCGISVKTVTKAVKKLLECGYIKKIRQYFVDCHKLGTYIYIIDSVKCRQYFFFSSEIFKKHLTITQLYVYLFCCKCADSKTKRFWNSYNDISDKLGISRSTAVKIINELEILKLITKIKMVKKNGAYSDNHYIINEIRRKKVKIIKKKSFSWDQKALQVLYRLMYTHKPVYIINHFYRIVKKKFLFCRGSPRISPLIEVPTFDTYRKRKVKDYT